MCYTLTSSEINVKAASEIQFMRRSLSVKLYKTHTCAGDKSIGEGPCNRGVSCSGMCAERIGRKTSELRF